MRTLGWLYFALIQLICTAFMLLGWVMLIPFCLSRAWTSDKQHWKSRILDIVYGNPEDGIVGPSWYWPDRDDRMRAYLWSAWRNSVGGLKWAFRWKGGPFWRQEWRQWYAQAGFYPNGTPVLSVGHI